MEVVEEEEDKVNQAFYDKLFDDMIGNNVHLKALQKMKMEI